MAATTLHRIDGVKLSNGKQAYGSREKAAHLPVYLEYMRKIHKITLVIIKVGEPGGSAVSAKTHRDGNSGDVRRWNLTKAQAKTHIHQGTRLGAPPFERFPDEGFDSHFHDMLNTGKRHDSSYQIDAMRRGRDGLVRNGPDRSKASRPPQREWLTWDKGIAQMLKEMDPRPTVSLKYLLGNVKKRTAHLRVKRVQKSLAKLGYYTLKIDGLWGPKTGTAYKKWQKSLYKNPKSSDGIPGRDSLTKLGDRTKVFRAHQFTL